MIHGSSTAVSSVPTRVSSRPRREAINADLLDDLEDKVG